MGSLPFGLCAATFVAPCVPNEPRSHKGLPNSLLVPVATTALKTFVSFMFLDASLSVPFFDSYKVELFARWQKNSKQAKLYSVPHPADSETTAIKNGSGFSFASAIFMRYLTVAEVQAPSL